MQRVSLSISLPQLAQQILGNISLGDLISIEPMLVGYEELNIFMKTTRGTYVIKVFSKDKDLETITSNVTALLHYERGGVPVPKLYTNADSEALMRVPETSTYYIVMDYFDGEKFTDTAPTLQDKKNIAQIISRIHTLSFETNATYDPWLTKNLPQEFALKKQYLDSAEIELIQKIVDDFSAIDFNKCSKAIGHFDLHRENVMKNDRGEYCVLDLACTDYGYKVLDLATYLALFCTEITEDATTNAGIYGEIIDAYLECGTLADYEKQALITCVNATFASNFLLPKYLQATGEDQNPEQTVYYKSIGAAGIKLSKALKNIL